VFPSDAHRTRYGDEGLTRARLMVGSALVLAGVLDAAVVLGRPNALTSGAGSPPTGSVPVTLRVAGETDGRVPWSRPLALTAHWGTVKGVRVTSRDGVVGGTLRAGGWTSGAALVPSTAYRLQAFLSDPDGRVVEVDRTVTTGRASSAVRVVLSPDLRTVGIASPIIARFDHPVLGAAARAAAVARLKVTTNPPVEGGWHWTDSHEAHYRGRSYWTPGTRIRVDADLHGLHLPGTATWGAEGRHTATTTIGEAVVSTVDVTAHTMTVRRNGAVLRTLPVSTGSTKYPTKGGVHIVLELQRVQIFDSATVGIPRSSPDGYLERLPYSVRISDGGAFVHANPATTRFQGRLNVSHGCVNLSLPDAAWFFSVARRGDVVDVTHAAVPPVLSDPGMADWNTPFDRWRQPDR